MMDAHDLMRCIEEIDNVRNVSESPPIEGYDDGRNYDEIAVDAESLTTTLIALVEHSGWHIGAAVSGEPMRIMVRSTPAEDQLDLPEAVYGSDDGEPVTAQDLIDLYNSGNSA